MLKTILYIVILTNVVHASDVGFDLLFSTNKEEYENYQIQFDRPLPQWLKGSMIRNGLGQFSMGDSKFTHAFDAYGKLMKVTVNGSHLAKFSTKFIRSRFYDESIASDTIAPFILFEKTQPPFSYFERMEALFNGVDNTNVNLIQFQRSKCKYLHQNINKSTSNSTCLYENTYLANSDFWPGYQFSGSLDTKRQLNAPLPDGIFWSSKFPLPSTSHPIKQYDSENYISFVSVINPLPFGPKSSINVISMTSLKRRKLIASIPRDRIPYMHSFALTENYAVIFASPAMVDIGRIIRTGNPIGSIDWLPELGTDIYVVNIHTGKIMEFHIDQAELNLHFINAWERNNKIFVDYINYSGMDMMKEMQIHTLHNRMLRNNITASPILARYKILLNKDIVKRMKIRQARPRSLSPVDSFDFPTINENYRFKKYCYIYGISMKSDRVNLSSIALIKKDLCGGKKDRIVYIENHYFNEPHFVPKKNGIAEDDGVILSLVLDGVKKISYIAVFNARDMTMVSKALLPTAVPFTLHGNFYENET